MSYCSLGISLITIGTFLCMMRWISIYKFYKNGYTSSQAPFVGGILICIGFYIVPTLKNFWYLGFLMDSSLSWEWVTFFFRKLIKK